MLLANMESLIIGSAKCYYFMGLMAVESMRQLLTASHLLAGFIVPGSRDFVHGCRASLASTPANAREVRRDHKQNKIEQGKKKPKIQYLLELLSKVCADSANVPEFFSSTVLLMPKDNGLVPPDIFFDFAPRTSVFLTPYISDQDWKRTCLWNISVTCSKVAVCTCP